MNTITGYCIPQIKELPIGILSESKPISSIGWVEKRSVVVDKGRCSSVVSTVKGNRFPGWVERQIVRQII